MINKKNVSIVLGIMCFALTIGICIQIKTVKKYSSPVSTSYEVNNLRTQVLKYKERYDDIIEETEKIDNELQREIEKATENNSELEYAKNQIIDGNKIIGLSEVKGPGVVIRVEDSKIDLSKLDINKSMDLSNYIVHDMDLLKVVNELKNAGAEAISINEQRIISTTSIICGGNTISINGEKIGSPFVIKAIGSPEALANLERPGGCIANLKERELVAVLKKDNDITIPKYSGVLNFKYLSYVD